MQHPGGVLLPPVRTLVATCIFFRFGERKCKSNPPFPKIADLQQKVGDFYFSTIPYSLFTKAPRRFLESNKK